MTPRIAISAILKFSAVTFVLHVHASTFAQTTSRGPGKGPPTPGSGSKYTYPQPPKLTPFEPKRIDPGQQVPDVNEKCTWVLSVKDPLPGDKSDEVPVYAFGDRENWAIRIGVAKVGETVTFEEFRQAKGRNFYKFNWSGAADKSLKLGPNPTFWVDGQDISCTPKT